MAAIMSSLYDMGKSIDKRLQDIIKGPTQLGGLMKNFIVNIRFFGLTGEYLSRVDVRAKTEASAKKKASKVIGNRDGYVVSVIEGIMQGIHPMGMEY